MFFNSRVKRTYSKKQCIVCGFKVSTDKYLLNQHNKTRIHTSILNIKEDQIDESKLEPQRNESDEYYLRREEYERRKKLDDKKPWLDFRFHKDSKQYSNYCNICDGFISGQTLEKHENSDAHWDRFQTEFMISLKNLLSKCKHENNSKQI